MGIGDFFKTIATGAGAALNFVKENSGTILGVAGAIGKAAGIFAVADDLDEFGDDPTLDLQANFNTATQYLIDQAVEDNDNRVAELGNLLGSEVLTSSDTLSGVWSLPAGLDDGNPPVDIQQDLSKFLAQQCLPTTFVDSTQRVQDIGRLCAQGAFADLGVELASGKQDGRGVSSTPFSINFLKEGFALNGMHKYYALPMGQQIADDTLHSAINLKTVTTNDFRVAHAKHVRSFHVKATSVQTGAGWLVTLQILWTGIEIAQQVLPIVKDYFENKLGTYAIVYNSQTGNVQLIKIQAPEGVSPAQTRAVLTDAVSSALQKLTTPPRAYSIMEGSTNNITQQLPSISITNSAITVGTAAQVSQRTSKAPAPIPEGRGTSGSHYGSVEKRVPSASLAMR